ncbi:outer membrane beta-barrel protein [Pedobacter sp. V48]|uniref:outer membrane beta-barrel protein n=1 Tax=Pedobacter sp. V48 TaxID=509635 RepID=UPI0004B40671|nr:outer membrane beta-barrel protein [Pedobacter sp. V48]
MKNLQLRLLLIIGFFAIITSYSQSAAQTITPNFSVTGKLMDSLTNKPAGWATINIIGTTNAIVKTGISDSTGIFILSQIPSGTYKLEIVSVGYKPKTFAISLQDTTKQQVNQGLVLLSPDAKQLKGVNITGSKPIVTQEIDRLVYDLQADPDSKGNSLLEMMRKIPFVSLDAEQNIRLKNSTSFKIFINGRPSGMIENNPKEVLRSMPASTIEKIEVITNPPAKYDAEGFAGIINIVTNKKPADGYNGSLNFNESFPAGGPGVGGSFNFKSGKLIASVFTGGSLSKTPATINNLVRNDFGDDPQTLIQDGNSKSRGRTGYLGTDVSYEITPLQLLSAQINLNGNKNSQLNNQVSSLTQNGDLLQGYHVQNTYEGHSDYIDASVNYQISSKSKKGKALTLSYRYTNFNSNNQNNLILSQITNYPYSGFLQNNQAGSNEHTAQADYSDKFKNWGLESGIKAILRSNSSNFDYSAAQFQANDFEISQDVFSAYTSVAYNHGKNIGIKAGLRAEQTIVDGDISQDYLNLIPSLSIAYQLKGGDNINFGFSQRLRRPGINRLNPFVDRSNPNTESTGNPNLMPSSVNNILAGYNHNGKVSVNLGLAYSLFSNLDFRIFTYDPTSGITRNTFANIGKGAVLAADLNLGYTATKNLNFSFNGSFNYLDIKTEGNVIPPSKDLFYNFTLTGGYRPTPEWRLGANLSVIGKNPASKTFQSITQGQVNTSFSSSHELIKGKLNLTAALNNPFYKFRTLKTTTSGFDFTELSNNQSYLRSYRISLNYNFGRLKDEVRKTRRGIKNDDVSN